MTTFINLFFVPAVALYLCYRYSGQTITPKLELLFQYCVAAALLVPAARVLLLPTKFLLHMAITVDSAYYTIAALLAAWLLSFGYGVSKNISLQIEVLRNEEK